MSNEANGPKSEETYELRNAYDDLVRTQVWKMMSDMDMCKCQKCYLDACALVFNRKYTRFVTTRQGELLSQVPEMSQANHVEMTVIILEALRMVQESPQH